MMSVPAPDFVMPEPPWLVNVDAKLVLTTSVSPVPTLIGAAAAPLMPKTMFPPVK